MNIDETINKWFYETSAQMQNHFKTADLIDMLCAAVLKVSSNYCNAILSLNNNHKMPAKALLRILCELTAKLVWCLFVSDKNEENPDDIICKRIQRWAKYTLTENKKMLESLKNSMPDDRKTRLVHDIESLKEQIENIEPSAMPAGTKIFEELTGLWKTGVYPVYYKQFNNAVHLDLQSLGGFIKTEGNKIFCLDDSEENVDGLDGYCMDLAYHINYFIRKHYNWDISQAEKEYGSLSGQ